MEAHMWNVTRGYALIYIYTKLSKNDKGVGENNQLQF